MKNIWCKLGSHKYTKWETISETTMSDKLKRVCIRCNKIDEYNGFTEVCIITGEKSPYIMKH